MFRRLQPHSCSGSFTPPSFSASFTQPPHPPTMREENNRKEKKNYSETNKRSTKEIKRKKKPKTAAKVEERKPANKESRGTRRYKAGWTRQKQWCLTNSLTCFFPSSRHRRAPTSRFRHSQNCLTPVRRIAYLRVWCGVVWCLAAARVREQPAVRSCQPRSRCRPHRRPSLRLISSPAC